MSEDLSGLAFNEQIRLLDRAIRTFTDAVAMGVETGNFSLAEYVADLAFGIVETDRAR